MKKRRERLLEVEKASESRGSRGMEENDDLKWTVAGCEGELRWE